MEMRLARADYERRKAAGNTRRALKRLVDDGQKPGLLGYLDLEPVVWVSVQPREAFARFATSRVLAPVDDKPVWSIACFFVDKRYRRQGISVALIEGAVTYARDRGARIVEGYPVEPKKKEMPPVFAWTGLAAAYRRARFQGVARRSATRPIMRRTLRPSRH